MNIQIFGSKKCFDTKKAERYFKERGIKFQKIDLLQKGVSPGELKSITQSVCIENLINKESPYYKESVIAYTEDCDTIQELLLASPKLLKTPIVRNGKKASVGYQPDTWKSWSK